MDEESEFRLEIMFIALQRDCDGARKYRFKIKRKERRFQLKQLIGTYGAACFLSKVRYLIGQPIFL